MHCMTVSVFTEQTRLHLSRLDNSQQFIYSPFNATSANCRKTHAANYEKGRVQKFEIDVKIRQKRSRHFSPELASFSCSGGDWQKSQNKQATILSSMNTRQAPFFRANKVRFRMSNSIIQRPECESDALWVSTWAIGKKKYSKSRSNVQNVWITNLPCCFTLQRLKNMNEFSFLPEN